MVFELIIVFFICSCGGKPAQIKEQVGADKEKKDVISLNNKADKWG